MSTEIVHIQNQNYAALVKPEDMETFEMYKGLRPTAMVLVQPTTQSVTGVMPGKFVDKSTGEIFDEIEMIILGISEPRNKYPSEVFKKGEKPICKSRDGVTPITDNPDLDPQAPNCKSCEHSSWKGYNFKLKTGKKPSCRSSRLVYFINRVTGLPHFIQVNGKATKAVDAMKESITRAAIGFTNKMKRAGTPRSFKLYDFVVKAGAKPGDDGPYFNFNPVKIDPMTAEDAQEYELMRLALLARQEEYRAMYEAEEAAAAEDDAVEGIAEGTTSGSDDTYSAPGNEAV